MGYRLCSKMANFLKRMWKLFNAIDKRVETYFKKTWTCLRVNSWSVQWLKR